MEKAFFLKFFLTFPIQRIILFCIEHNIGNRESSMNLYFLNGKKKGEQWELVPPGICIGREADNDIQLLTAGVSRYHAKIEYTGDGQWKILDLGSTNGTRVDGKKIESGEILKKGSEIIIGEQMIRFDQDFKPAPSKPEEKPAVQPEKRKPAAAENKLDSKIDLDIFNRSRTKTAADGRKEVPSPKKRIVNLLFALLVTVMACIAILVFFLLSEAQKEDHRKRPVQVSRNPFFLEYEKTITSRDNVFRFSVCIENNSAQFKLNDLKYQRRFSKGISQVDNELLKTLIREIKGTDFMKIQSDPPGSPVNGLDETRTLTIGYDTSMNSVTVRNTFPKSSFETIEYALARFADDYGLKTISLSQKEMREEAERSFRKAEELLANYQAKPENLRNAILRYNTAIDFLDQFDPKPEEWTISKRKLAEAETLMKKAIKDAEFNIKVLNHKKEYGAAAAECGKLLQIMDPEHKAYQKVRDWKIAFEKKLSLQKKKGRR